MRRLLVAVAVAGAALAPFAAPASADPPCYGAYAGDWEIGYCAGFVCNDLCYWESYPVCSQPADHPADTCALVTAVLSVIG